MLISTVKLQKNVNQNAFRDLYFPLLYWFAPINTDLHTQIFEQLQAANLNNLKTDVLNIDGTLALNGI